MFLRSQCPQLGLVALVIATLAGCSGGDAVVQQTPAPPTTASAGPSSAAPTTNSASPTPSATTSAEEAAILMQYGAYFDTEPAAQRLTSRAMRDVLVRKVAVDPFLSATLSSMTAASAVGEIYYGKPVLHPKVTLIKGKYAQLTDCQDTSKTGRKKVTGATVTVGRANVLANSTMVLGADGVWRLGALAYDRAASCTA